MPTAEEIASRLEGTATTDIGTVLEENEWEIDSKTEGEVYHLVDICQSCGWWFRLSELKISSANEYVCDECIPKCSGCGEPIEEDGEYCGGNIYLELEER